MPKVHIFPGPSSANVSREQAEATLLKHPHFPKGASYSLAEVEGRWITAIAADDEDEKDEEKEEDEKKEAAKTAGPFPPDGGEGPPPGAEDAGPPAPDDGPPVDDGAGADDTDGEDKPKGEKGEKKGEGAELHQVIDMLTTLMGALGLTPGGPEDSPVPGADGPQAPPGPPQGEEEQHQTVRHERGLKPGESPPGVPPVGTPSFSSVADDHPWKDILGQKRSFTVEEQIGDQPMNEVLAELRSLAKNTGYQVQRLVEDNASGQRVARAIIARAA